VEARAGTACENDGLHAGKPNGDSRGRPKRCGSRRPDRVLTGRAPPGEKKTAAAKIGQAELDQVPNARAGQFPDPHTASGRSKERTGLPKMPRRCPAGSMAPVQWGLCGRGSPRQVPNRTDRSDRTEPRGEEERRTSGKEGDRGCQTMGLRPISVGTTTDHDGEQILERTPESGSAPEESRSHHSPPRSITPSRTSPAVRHRTRRVV